MNSDKKETKTWKNIAHFDTFAEADELRNELKCMHALVKVRRASNTYRVKVWDPPEKDQPKVKKVKNKFKKGDNSTRREKNENKKVRYRPEQS